MLHSTKGIVIRTIKYGDTSIITTIYTELFGIQTYLVNGVRTDKKSSNKANIYQPSTLLEMIVYHTPNRNLQRIKEARVHFLYQSVYHSFVKNTIAIYISELITKTISEPECNEDLYTFFEKAFLKIDSKSEQELANYPIVFTLELARELGFGIQNQYSELYSILDLINGQFCSLDELKSLHYIDGEYASIISELSSSDLISHNLNHEKRKAVMNICIQYLKLHIPHMSDMKSLEVLDQIMS